MSYDFALNQVKLARAEKRVRDSGKPVNEESVKAEYLLLGGALVSEKPKIVVEGKKVKIIRKK